MSGSSRARGLNINTGFYWSYCASCNKTTYLMAWAKGKGKAERSAGLLIGIRCHTCGVYRAVTGSNPTSLRYGT